MGPEGAHNCLDASQDHVPVRRAGLAPPPPAPGLTHGLGLTSGQAPKKLLEGGGLGAQGGGWVKASCGLWEVGGGSRWPLLLQGLGTPGQPLRLHWRVPLQKQAPLQLRQVPRGEVFRPHRQHLAPVDLAEVTGDFWLLGCQVLGARSTGSRGGAGRPTCCSQGHEGSGQAVVRALVGGEWAQAALKPHVCLGSWAGAGFPSGARRSGFLKRASRPARSQLQGRQARTLLQAPLLPCLTPPQLRPPASLSLCLCLRE